MIHRWVNFWLLATATALFAAMPLDAAEPARLDGQRLFVTEIRPLFAEKCLACHGTKADDIKSSFDLRTRESTLRGGESGEPAIVPGKPEQSLLYQAVRWDGLEMPPKKNDRLSSEQIDLIRQWITAGAPWVDEMTKASHREQLVRWRWCHSKDKWRLITGMDGPPVQARKYLGVSTDQAAGCSQAGNRHHAWCESDRCIHSGSARESWHHATGGHGRQAHVYPPRNVRSSRLAADDY